jgi:truncated hemoglobin YjbI
MSSENGKPTLYERLGGVYSIAAVVDDFIDRVMHNPVLNANGAAGFRSVRLWVHSGQTHMVATLSACPLRSDRVRHSAPQRSDATCQKRPFGPRAP